MFPIYSTTAHKSKRKACTKNQKAKDNAWNPGCRTEEIDVIAISNRNEVMQLPSLALSPLEQITVRKALAPFSTICQNMTQLELEKYNKRNQIIYEPLKKDRDSKFAKMGTWKITKMVSKDGRVCLRTEATDKFDFLVNRSKTPQRGSPFMMNKLSCVTSTWGE